LAKKFHKKHAEHGLIFYAHALHALNIFKLILSMLSKDRACSYAYAQQALKIQNHQYHAQTFKKIIS
jgi:hypothetical protein